MDENTEILREVRRNLREAERTLRSLATNSPSSAVGSATPPPNSRPPPLPATPSPALMRLQALADAADARRTADGAREVIGATSPLATSLESRGHTRHPAPANPATKSHRAS